MPRQEDQGVTAAQPYSTVQDENHGEQSQNNHAINETTEEQVHGTLDGNEDKAASSPPSESAPPRPIDADDEGGSRVDLGKAAPGDESERDGKETKGDSSSFGSLEDDCLR